LVLVTTHSARQSFRFSNFLDYLVIELVPLVVEVWPDEGVVVAEVKVSAMDQDCMQVVRVDSVVSFFEFWLLIWLKQGLKVEHLVEFELLIIFEHDARLHIEVVPVKLDLQHRWQFLEPDELLSILHPILFGVILILPDQHLRL